MRQKGAKNLEETGIMSNFAAKVDAALTAIGPQIGWSSSVVVEPPVIPLGG